MELVFVDAPTAADDRAADDGAAGAYAGDWQALAGEHAPPARRVVEWAGPIAYGYDCPRRIGGVVVQPARTALGLRGWEDAFEGVMRSWGHEVVNGNDGRSGAEGSKTSRPQDLKTPYVLFDVEKIVRMMLHQSGLALEILAGHAVVFDDGSIPARTIVEKAITADALAHYADVARALLAGLEAGEAQADAVRALYRHALCGLALAEGRVSFRLDALVAERAIEGWAALEDDAAPLEALVDQGRGLVAELVGLESTALPSSPSDYDWLNDFVVSARLAG